MPIVYCKHPLCVRIKPLDEDGYCPEHAKPKQLEQSVNKGYGMIEEVQKGGECWLQLSIARRAKGLEIFAKADPRVEEFIIALSVNGDYDQLEMLSRNWYSLDPEKPIQVYRLEKDLKPYVLLSVGASVRDKFGNPNLSFLQFVGLSKPEGIKYGVAGPFNRSYARALSSDIAQSCRDLFKDYIVPIHINIRISSQELVG